MLALKNKYARLNEKAGIDQTKLDALKIKIGSACAVGLLTDEEQLDLIASMPAAATSTTTAQ